MKRGSWLSKMAAEGLKDGDYQFCALCRQNHNTGKKHIYTKKHKTNLHNTLKKFLKKVSIIFC